MGEWMADVVACQTEEEAERVFNEILMTEYLGERRRNKWSPEAAEKALREVIGYNTGYYDRETQERVFRLFHTEHPIFGLETSTTCEEFWSGRRMAIELEPSLDEDLSDEARALMMKHTEKCQQIG